MKENKKGYQDKAIDRPFKKDDSNKLQPNSADPNEEKGTPSNELPIANHPHTEELLDYIPE